MSDPLHLGHRLRLKKRLQQDSSALVDYEILELLLGYALPRRDTKPLAKELLQRFGHLRGVLDAMPTELQTVEGFGPGLATFFVLIREVLSKYAEAPVRSRESLCTPAEVAQFAGIRLSNCPHEEVWIATVDAQNRLISWEKLNKGSVGTVPFYPRDVLELCLQRKASGFILVHNHPGATPQASIVDLETTKHMERLAQAVGLRLVDHLIVGNGVHYSIRQEALL